MGGLIQFLLALMYVLDVHPLSMFVDLSFSEALKDWLGTNCHSGFWWH